MNAIIAKDLPSGRVFLERYGGPRSQVDYWTPDQDSAFLFASAQVAVEVAEALGIGEPQVLLVGW